MRCLCPFNNLPLVLLFCDLNKIRVYMPCSFASVRSLWRECVLASAFQAGASDTGLFVAYKPVHSSCRICAVLAVFAFIYRKPVWMRNSCSYSLPEQYWMLGHEINLSTGSSICPSSYRHLQAMHRCPLRISFHVLNKIRVYVRRVDILIFSAVWSCCGRDLCVGICHRLLNNIKRTVGCCRW